MRLLSRTSRRQFLCSAAALGAASAVPTRFAVGQTPPVTLPARGEVLIRGGHVMTMDAATGDVAGGDVHVRNGAIVAVGRGLAVPGAEVIDADGMIVLPGLVETPLAHVEHAVAQHGDR
jgi:adenine deaminase